MILPDFTLQTTATILYTDCTTAANTANYYIDGPSYLDLPFPMFGDKELLEKIHKTQGLRPRDYHWVHPDRLKYWNSLAFRINKTEQIAKPPPKSRARPPVSRGKRTGKLRRWMTGTPRK